MPCVSPDGKPTKSGIATLSALKSGAATPEDVSKVTGNPLFKVRSGLRELVNAGFAKQEDDKYQITPEGSKLVV
ncbi:MAG: helix-turn-helix domain-containing protein [Candidatus Bathyarchaeota archaeon]|nr:helix-turn-helix domain-containing protein [Candidatus Bathyarchaeum sp.]